MFYYPTESEWGEKYSIYLRQNGKSYPSRNNITDAKNFSATARNFT